MNRLAVSVACAAQLALGCGEIAHLGNPPSLDGSVPADGSAPDAAEDVASDSPKSLSDVLIDEASVADAHGYGEGSDAGTDAPIDAAGDVQSAPGSCLDVLRASPDAGSGVYPIVVNGNSVHTYCDMDLDDGGWTAFYVGRLGTLNVFAHFEDATDTCPSPGATCLRHPPATVTPANDFAVQCGADAIRFNAPGTVVEYWELGVSSAWEPLSNAVAVAGQPNTTFAKYFFTGEGPTYPLHSRGWVIGGDYYKVQETFASSFDSNSQDQWDWCNGVDYNGDEAGTGFPIVRLLYR
jgi:hypothetical protein